jgi:hypothetical protein
MKQITLYVFLFFVIIYGCSKDTEKKYNFKNQNLSGKINGATWTQKSGLAQFEAYYTDSTISFNMFNASTANICQLFPETNEIFFSLPKQTGLYLINWNPENPQMGVSLTMYCTDNHTNYIATSGAIEILSISQTEITGRIDAYNDDFNYVNGNFTVPVCSY